LRQRDVDGVHRLARRRVSRGPSGLARLRGVVAVALRRDRLVLVDESEPVARRFALARSDLEEDFLDALGDGAASALADRDAINRAYGCDFGGGAGEEKFVGDVECGALYAGFDERDFERAANLDDAVARDARKDGRRERRRYDLALVHEEDVLTRPFRDVAAVVQGDAFGVAVRDGLHLDELRVHVVRAGLRHRGHRVRRQTVPRRDAHVNALLDGLVAEVL